MTDPKMSDQALSQVLHQIAEQRISEDMDMWPELQDKLKQPPRRAIFNSRAGRVTLALAAVLLLSVAVYAVDFLAQISTDPGLEAAGVTEIDQTQEFENGTITVHYAYADANRVTVALSSEISVPSNFNASLDYQTTLTDDQGHTYTPIFGGGGGGGGGGAESGATPTTRSVLRQVTNSYDATIIEGQPEALNLRLEVNIVAGMSPTGPMGGSGGGGGGGPEPTGEAAQAPTSMPTATFEAPGPIVFEFTVPFNPGMVMEEPQTVTANDLELTLQEVVVTPSLARFELCFEAPAPSTSLDFEPVWVPLVSINHAGEGVVSATEFITNQGRNGQSTCKQYHLAQSLDDYQGEWTLTIEALSLPGSENTEAVVADLREAGIDAEAFPGGGFGFGGAPENMTPEEVDQIVNEAMRRHRETYTGPWVFTFDMQ